ncbi:MAG: oligosaccharide flippase family protein [Bacteroidales bacterium]|nr:oligosaccharide flippase family protein [Bacteroidales bacterium]
MNPLKQLAGQTAVYGMGTIVPRMLNYLLLTPFYTRIFQLGQYGVVTELYAYVAFLMVLLTYGMETAFFRFAETEKNTARVYSTSLISLFTTSIFFIIVVLIFSQPIADLIQYSSNKEYVTYFALIVGIDAICAIPFARLRQQNKASRFAIIKIINVSVNIGFNFFFLWLCPILIANNPESFVNIIYSEDIGVGYAFISNLIATVITLILLIPDIYKIKLIIDRDLLKRMLKYAFPLLIVGLAGMINEVSDKVFLKYLLPFPETAMQQLGIYGANFKLAILMTLFIQMFRFAAEPFFFAQAKERNSKKVYADVMKYFVIFGLIIFLGVMLYIDIVKYFIGKEFREGLNIVPIVLLANLFLGIFFNLSIWYKLNNITRYGAYIALLGAFITVLLNVIFIPVIGYLGSALAHFACYFTMMVVSFFLGRKFFPINYNLKAIFGYFSLALTLYYISTLLHIESQTYHLLINTILMLIFLSIVFFIEKPNFSKSGAN